MKRGKLIGVGVGPGDPELMTVKAARLLEQAEVVAFISTAGRSSRAREIASSFLPSKVRELAVVMPMGGEPGAAQRAYGQLASSIIGELGAGHDVCFLCEGDPLFYGSFIHLVETLGPRFACSSIPGITSFAAAAAKAMRPLAVRDQPLAILPATMTAARLERLAKENERVVVIKIGKHLEKARKALSAAGMLDEAVLVEHASNGNENVTWLRDVQATSAPYFSLVLANRPAKGMDPERSNASGVKRTPAQTRRRVGHPPGDARRRQPNARRPPTE